MSEDTVQNKLYGSEPPAKQTSTRKLLPVLLVIVLIIAVAVTVILLLVPNKEKKKDDPKKQKIAAMIGAHELSIAEANYFYIDYITETYDHWCEVYGSNTDTYLALLYDLDVTKPLDQQYYDSEASVTWAEFLADKALTEAAQIYALYDAAKAEGFILSEERREEVESTLEMYRLYGEMYGYKDTAQYLRSIYGTKANKDSFKAYLLLCATADAYYAYQEERFTYTDADRRAYETGRYHQFSSFTYSHYYIDADNFLSGGALGQGGSVVYTPQEKQAALEAAKKTADTIAQSGAVTQEELDSAIEKHAPGQGRSTLQKDRLYEAIPDALADWLCYEGRQEGDITLVAQTQTSSDGTPVLSGYNIYLFHSRNENTYPLVDVRHILFSYPQDATEDEKRAVLDKAYAVLDTYNAGEQTEDSFVALVEANTDDPGSVNNGGLYENVYPGQMIRAFNDWCFDDARQYADVDIIESEYGLHLMFYAGPGDMSYRDLLITEVLYQTDLDAWSNSLTEGVTVSDIDLDLLLTDHIIAP